MTSIGIETKSFVLNGAAAGTICVLLLDCSPMIPSTFSTWSSLHPQIIVVFPKLRNPPVVANLVTMKPFLFNAFDTLELSSLETMARTSFISVFLSFFNLLIRAFWLVLIKNIIYVNI